MPSALVHVALGGLLAAALLTAEFDARSLGVVAAATLLPDLDTFAGLAVPGAHRALLHTLLFPALLTAAFVYDTRLRDRSLVDERWGRRGVRVGGVSLVALLFAGVLPDLCTNGVNVFYPVHDAFYALDGRFVLSNQRGVVQTFVEWEPGPPERTTENVHYWTGVDPKRGAEPANVERLFSLVASGLQQLLVATGALVVGARLRMASESPGSTR